MTSPSVKPSSWAVVRGWLAARRPTGNGLAISAIVAGAFVLSYTTLYQLALACGYSPWLARVWPVLVDGFTAYCSRDAWRAYQQRAWGRVAYDGLVVLAATGASALFQAEAATAAWLLERPPVGLVQAVHVVPAVAALLALEIGMHQRTQTTAPQQPPAPSPTMLASGGTATTPAVHASAAAAAALPHAAAAVPPPVGGSKQTAPPPAVPVPTRPAAAERHNGGRTTAAHAVREQIAALVAEEAVGRRAPLTGEQAAARLGGAIKARRARVLLRQERQRLTRGEREVDER